MACTMWGVEKYKVFHISERKNVRNQFKKTIIWEVLGYHHSSKELKKEGLMIPTVMYA